jgi:hypothetical protein
VPVFHNGELAKRRINAARNRRAAPLGGKLLRMLAFAMPAGKQARKKVRNGRVRAELWPACSAAKK